MDEIIPTISLNTVKNCAIYLLACREHSQFELRQKLKKRQFPDDLIEKVIQQLSADKHQSDERFAQCYVRMRSKKGYGTLRIQAELRERGVNEIVITDILAGEREQWRDQIKQVFQKKFGQQVAKDYAGRAKQMRFLQYRGFTPDQIKEFCNYSATI